MSILKPFSICVFCLVLGISLLCSTVMAQVPCAKMETTVFHRSTLATASFFANLRNKPGSVQFESRKMFQEARDKARKEKRPAKICESDCNLKKWPKMQFRSTPNKTLRSYGDYRKCQNYLERTQKSPISFQKHLPLSLDSLTEWIGDFSRGQGAEGERLYDVCDGSCSPQYSYLIQVLANDEILVDAEVVCGHARDKGDNLYLLDYSLLWRCEG